MKTIVWAGWALLLAGCGVSGSYPETRADSAPGDLALASPMEPSAADAGSSREVVADASPEEGGGAAQGQSSTAGTLTAGEWRDLDNWDFFLSLFGTQRAEAEGIAVVDSGHPDFVAGARTWGFHFGPRAEVVVRSEAGQPAVDTEVRLIDQDGRAVWRARTDRAGRVSLFPGVLRGAKGGRFTVRASGVEVPWEAGQGPVLVEVASAAPPEARLDVAFVIDTTGSMGDELSYLQSELRDVIERSRASLSGVRVRTSVNFYRDEGDAYVVRSYPFTETFSETQSRLASETVDGGGDYPEAVEEGLADGVLGHSWSSSARARLLFLVLDAPPHATQDRILKLQRTIEEASRLGIRVVPVAASGVDKSTECLLRCFAAATQGTYVFLTDHSGVGNSHIKPTIGQFRVEKLNDLLTRLIVDAGKG